MNLSEVSIRRPVFATMLVLGLVVLGLISLQRLEMNLDPDLEFPFLTVETELRGASPQTVEREVTDPIEESINSIEGIRTLGSVSSQGRSRVFVEFEMGYEVDIKAQEVRDKVAVARAALPGDAEDPVVQKFDLNAIPFLTLALGGPVSLREISDLAEHEVKERLERLPSVGGVTIVGAREREIRIWLDPLRLSGYGLSIQDVSDTLRRENAEVASGRIEGSTREWSVTTQGRARSVEEFGAIIVAERAGRLVRLRDVAVVEDGMSERRSVARLNGEPAVAMEIRLQSGGDLVAAARHVRAEVQAMRPGLPPGVQLEIVRDYATAIEDQVRSVFLDMGVATALVVLVVLLFLRNVRSTFIASLAIPASVISAFTFFLVFDLSLNIMTLMALSLAVGLVIDDAIVVLESIFRRVERGQDARAAGVEGSREVALAVISTTLAVCGVFVPIAFMTSMIGRYFYEFGVAVTVAVCISTLVALTLTPMLASRLLQRRRTETGAFFRPLERATGALDAGYRSLLARALRQRLVTVAVGIAAVVGGLWVATTLPVDLFSQDDFSEGAVELELPIGVPLAITDAAMRRLEQGAAGHPHVRGVLATAGSAIRHEPHRAHMNVMLVPRDDRDGDIEVTFAELDARLAPLVPEAKSLSVGHPKYGDSGEFSDIHYSLQGPELERLGGYALTLVERMRADPAFAGVSTSFETGRPEISLDVDRGRAADLGVSAQAIGRTIRTLLAGEKVGSFEQGGRRYDVRVQVLPEYRDDPSKIDLVRIRSLRGELVPLTNAARIRFDEGAVEIRRQNRTREIQVRANMATGYTLGDGAQRLEAWGGELGISAPDALVPGGGARRLQETAEDIAFAFGLAIVSIYMILASLFNSFTHPFVIMVSAPLSFIGGFVALKLSGLSLDMMSGIGLLVLMGLVMKNGILLVDYTNQLREAGRSQRAAILEAGPVRMRPVLMTSGALIFGMIPMVLAEGPGSGFRAPMAVITIGGLITSTLLTLVVVPVVYSLVDDATVWTRGAVARIARRVVRRVRAPRSA